MIYPESAFEKLGFEAIKALLKNLCMSPMGKELAGKITPLYAFQEIQKFLLQSKEMKDIIENDAPLPIDHFYPIQSLAERAQVEGVFLTEEEFFQLLLSLRTVFSIIQYFNDRPGQYVALESLKERLTIEKSIIQAIEQVLDNRGHLRDNASPVYQQLTADIAKAESEAHKKMEFLFKNAQRAGWTAEGNLTVRDGRLCIPLLAENKRKVKGFIHDESATGQTVFLEPEEVFHLNNRIRDLAFEKRREKIRILVQLTGALRPYIPALRAYHQFLGKIDFVRAKALLAVELDAAMPELSKGASMELKNARHPLLLLHFKKEQQTVVPLYVKIDDQQRIIVVSGPNAGGKSVALKTIGLLQLMAQSGLLIPADEDSKIGIFRRFFADIGDDQSLDSDLSTYSAHLSKMKYFLEYADAKTLVLIDEFGTGTDPQFGGPIAEAVLQELNSKKVRGVVTTHYSNLKVFASASEGIENASMLFDNRAMQPRYILEIGKPGSSYAFEIAYKIGLPRQVVDLAKNKIGIQQKKVDHLLVDLEREKKELYELKVAVEKKERQATQRQQENEQLHAYLEENRKSILKQAKLEAQEILKGANKLIENTISEIKQSKADKVKTQHLRDKIHDERLKHVVEKEPSKLPASKSAVPLTVGDWVRVLDTGTEAEVIDVSKDNVVLAMGDLRSVVKRKRVERIRGKAVDKSGRRSRGGVSTNEAVASFYPEIDVRGMRAEVALQEIEKYFDRAIMLGMPSLKIIHGKGDGILRKIIREYFRKYDQVQRLEDEHADRGGDGITYVYFD